MSIGIRNNQRYIGYELKSKYQRNYLLGLAAVCIFCLLFLLIHYLFLNRPSTNDAVRIQLNDSFITDIKSLAGHSKYAGDGFTGYYPISKPVEDIFPEGYIGAYLPLEYETKLREVSVKYFASINYEPAVPQDLSNMLINTAGESQDCFFGIGGGEDDYGFGETQPYMPVYRPKYIESRFGHVNIMSNQQAIVQIPQPGWPPRASYSDTGYVDIDLIIDTDGYITWRIINEIPKGCGFAVELIEALKRGRYIPAVKNGNTTEVRLRLNCMFCYDCEPSLTSSSTTVLTKLIR